MTADWLTHRHQRESQAWQIDIVGRQPCKISDGLRPPSPILSSIHRLRCAPRAWQDPPIFDSISSNNLASNYNGRMSTRSSALSKLFSISQYPDCRSAASSAAEIVTLAHPWDIEAEAADRRMGQKTVQWSNWRSALVMDKDNILKHKSEFTWYRVEKVRERRRWKARPWWPLSLWWLGGEDLEPAAPLECKVRTFKPEMKISSCYNLILSLGSWGSIAYIILNIWLALLAQLPRVFGTGRTC